MPCEANNIWGRIGVDFDQASLDQFQAACNLPVAVAAALMPDAHVGYGLPIGGVLATDNAVIPYAVGVDIACRVCLSVLDIDPQSIGHSHVHDRLAGAIERETRFGVGAAFTGADRRSHPVLDEDWSVSSVTQRNKDKAWAQLGTSGSGNHFAEFGILTVLEAYDGPAEQRGEGGSHARWDLMPGTYVALLTHSGSRGTGAAVCDYYSSVARQQHPDLPKQQQHLGWLEMTSQAGIEYWSAMQLMGEYASANHACIHRAVSRAVGADIIAMVENHHNFAWRERHQNRDVVVHRKGATPAGRGVLGIIPGTMATPGYVVMGLGSAASLASSSHGAGRQLSRTKARAAFRFGTVRSELRERGITLLSAGADESPGAYKDIEHVMAQQRDLVKPIARFEPRIVKMAPEGERAED